MHGTRLTFICYFSLIQYGEGPTKSIFLPFMCSLRFFEIDLRLGSATLRDFDILSSLMDSLALCISLTSPAILEHLKLNIQFRGSSKRFINPIEKRIFFEDLRNAYAWTRLDTPLLLIQPCNELTLTSIIPFVSGMMSRMQSSLVYLYFARKAFCSSNPFRSTYMYRYII